MSSPEPPRTARSLRAFFGGLLQMVQLRLDLLSVEAREAFLHATRLLAFGVAAVLFLSAGAVFLALFITVALWEQNRLLALGMFATLFLTLGAGAAWIAWQAGSRTGRLFSASLAELEQDRRMLDPDT